ncbi:uncharacterized protein LOC134786618 [Penaeus indicus]|uniref:uncharacterized protein LOC134786618 n=1 Tax=Penaeus indicus TaxID=29960 RepID=UPI00300C1173
MLLPQNAASNASAGAKNSTTKSSALFCLLADLDGGQTGNSSVNANDPFASPTSAQAPASISQPSFANFENANIFTNTAEDQSQNNQDVQSCSPPQGESSCPPSPSPSSLAPPSQPSTCTPSPRLSPARFSGWEAFDGEEASAATPLIPMAESFPYPPSACHDASGRATNKGKHGSGIIFAAGVSAQFVCPTNPNFAACWRDECSASSLSASLPLSSAFTSSSFSSSSTLTHSSSTSNLPQHSSKNKDPEVSSVMAATPLLSTLEERTTKSIQALDVETTVRNPTPAKKPSQARRGSEQAFTYAALNVDAVCSGASPPVTNVLERAEGMKGSAGSSFHLNNRSNEIGSKCFAAFLSSTSKLSGTSYQNLASDNAHTSSPSDLDEISSGIKKLTTARKESFDELMFEMPVITAEKESHTIMGDEEETNPFMPNVGSPSASTGDISVFDNAPLFSKKKSEATKPIPIASSVKFAGRMSSSCLSTFPLHASPTTNPFVSVSQLATNPQQVVRPMGNQGYAGSYDSSKNNDVFLHECRGGQLFRDLCTDSSMTPPNYLFAGSTTSNKSTPSGPPPFSNNPLTPMTPGSSSALPTSSSSASSATTALSNNPTQDRYAALKDLDEEFKTQKESETTTGEW